ncbi:IS3 family transposase [Streptomyces olivoreticuli]
MAEIRKRAVRIVRETGKPIAQVARDRGINEGTLAAWISREKEATRAGLDPDERVELARLRKEEVTVADFIAGQRTSHQVPHAVSCRALEVSESWFYKWLGRPPTRRDEHRADVALAVKEVFDSSGGTYGSTRFHIELRERGWRVSKNTIARIMAELDLADRVKRRRRSLTRQGKRPVAPDLVGRVFTAETPNVLWCGDMTEIITDEGKLYL